MSNEGKGVNLVFLANDRDDKRHEGMVDQFAKLIQCHESYGRIGLIEALRSDNEETEYIICATWEDPVSGDLRTVPVGVMLDMGKIDGLYALPDGKGGYYGYKIEEEPDDTSDSEEPS